MSRVEIPVEGMHCTGCERAVSTALTRTEGVRDAKADFQEGRVRVHFDPDTVAEEELRRRIEEAGYQPR